MTTFLLILLLLGLCSILIELKRLTSPKGRPKVIQKALRYNNFATASKAISNEGWLGWEVVSHSVSPDGSWYVIYKLS